MGIKALSGPTPESTDFPIPVAQGYGHNLVVGTTFAGAGYTTIQEAVSAAAEGDVIFVQPGSYDENVVVTTDYLTIVGAQLGGYGRPDVVASTGVCLTVSAQGFVCKRLRFASQDGSDCVIQEGNGFKYEDCVFDDATDADEAGLRLKGNADDDSMTASEGLVERCLFRGSDNAIICDTGDAPGNGVGTTDCVVKACRFVGNTQDIVTADTGLGVYSVKRILIVGNSFEDKNKTNYIDMTTSNGGAAADQTGAIQGNVFAADAITAGNEVRIVGTGFTFSGNITTVGVKDGSGLD